jgi:hypothetical protein
VITSTADANIGSIMGIGFPAVDRWRRAVHRRLPHGGKAASWPAPRNWPPSTATASTRRPRCCSQRDQTRKSPGQQVSGLSRLPARRGTLHGRRIPVQLLAGELDRLPGARCRRSWQGRNSKRTQVWPVITGRPEPGVGEAATWARSAAHTSLRAARSRACGRSTRTWCGRSRPDRYRTGTR